MVEVIAIVGPTASGKTALSIELAERLGGEVINGDSMQVYRGMDIGTAKIRPEEMAGIPHHLLDIRNPEESFSVAEYQELVRRKIVEIQQRGKLPIIVGGTGLYVQSVLFDYRFSKQQVDEELRQTLHSELERLGPLAMHSKLMELNPGIDIHPNNTRRVLRALEILLSGEEKEDGSLAQAPMYDELIIGLDVPRAKLYERIDSRVDQMIGAGLLDEVRHLYDGGLRDVQSIKAIGYKELYGYFDGLYPLEEAVVKLKRNSRKYAKRQFTYFRNKMPILWLDATADKENNVEEIMRFWQENDRNRRIEQMAKTIR
ncbi:tRNA (adenosine(37)-N6)-dimethylallyltransferase MiaA [Planococcus sp. CP5-4]|uniref:tRNA (adenosine(37)-N6)-dimethylallyltransferase MiaA n=1 Tax=unclassified Planococcus (in: firmicutes) TaxID=2662419 RepID=UPI001C228254|nr:MULTISPECIES: tRNA (adenosine(37)-N6)-dimethylallyltransferase MiaA [unclassified Planococcus (in: firmicutes)]MBU9672032.1 tRNA (adenosine(37)-N6)-dimethylallyltransferase MiaA [Planococcus sp. CP5-4_YE]MBV0907595.1 tRNA (adenosine(37)-N6)-dimethylallyltransferase MiaA [Planococcus sp. CP5-4_UN]MBW6062762.1 tRNA (adenosine(37)-N6)-dimethylallyltransferase MiaA [Planococcus sp. CP5-4]